MKRSFTNMQTVDDEIEQNLILEDITEVDIHYLFSTMQLNDGNQKSLAHLIHNKSFWQDKIKTYFPFLLDTSFQRYQQDPYNLFAGKYTDFRKMAEEFKLPKSVFYLLFPALKGDLARIVHADISEENRILLYILSATNGHYLAIERLNEDQVGSALTYAAGDGNHRSVSLILLMYPNLQACHLKAASRCAAALGYLHITKLLQERLGKEHLSYLLYCYFVRKDYHEVEHQFVTYKLDQKAIDHAFEQVFELACDNRDLTTMGMIFEKLTDKGKAFSKICYHFRSPGLFQHIAEYFPFCIDVLTKNNVSEYMISCAYYGKAYDFEILFEHMPLVSANLKGRSLCIAASINNCAVLTLLLTHKACEDIAASTKGAALSRAIVIGNREAIKILLDHFSTRYGLGFAMMLAEFLHAGIASNYSANDFHAALTHIFYENEAQHCILSALAESYIQFDQHSKCDAEDISDRAKQRALAELKAYFNPPTLIFSPSSQNNIVIENKSSEDDIGMNIETKYKK